MQIRRHRAHLSDCPPIMSGYGVVMTNKIYKKIQKGHYTFKRAKFLRGLIKRIIDEEEAQY